MPRNENGPGDERDWPHTPPGVGLEGAPELDLDTDPAPDPAPERDWFNPPPDLDPDHPPVERRGLGRGLPVRGWAALAALAAVTVAVIAATHTSHESGPHTGPGDASTVPAATTTAAAGGACAGLSGTAVTDRGGDPATVAGVIAAFEADYYITRSAVLALRVVAPETGITVAALAAGIDSIPVGTTHCVAITPIAATTTTAYVHLVEVHPDQQRVDYLQVINTRPVPGGGLLISHFQEQG